MEIFDFADAEPMPADLNSLSPKDYARAVGARMRILGSNVAVTARIKPEGDRLFTADIYLSRELLVALSDDEPSHVVGAAKYIGTAVEREFAHYFSSRNFGKLRYEP